MKIRDDCSPRNKKKFGNLQKKLDLYCEDLRRKSTKYEKMLCKKLNYLNISYIHQYPIFDLKMQYIVDFYLPEYNLIIEVDGVIHNELSQKLKDKMRDLFLKRKGYKLIRISNEKLLNMNYDFLISIINNYRIQI